MLLKGKFFEPASGASLTGIDDSKMRLRSANYFRGRNAANTADINIIRTNASDVIEFPSVPQIVGTPVNPNDIATIAIVQSIAQGLRSTKDAVRALSSANIAISPGGASLVVDGVTMANGDRLALVGQTTASQNGIYVVSGVGTSVVLARATDAAATGQIMEGMAFLVEEGTINAKSQWMVTTAGAITVGTTAITIVKYLQQLAYTAGDMVTLVGTVFSVALSTASGLVSSNPGNPGGTLAVNPAANTMKINATNQIEGTKAVSDTFTLTATDITNQYVDLTQVAENAASLAVIPKGGPEQVLTTDYTVNLTGGAGSKTRVTFAGDLATAGAAALVAGDVLYISYRYL
jgi:hypothetical protein